MKSDTNSRNVEEIIIPAEKREEILNELRHCETRRSITTTTTTANTTFDHIAHYSTQIS